MLKVKINTKELQLFSAILFLINPLLGLLTIFNVFFSNWVVNKRKLINLFITFLAFFLAFLNSTKIPENDLIHHGSQYLMAGDYTFFQYLGSIYKEPLYYIFNYLFFYLSNGSFIFWVITFTFFSYFLFFQAVKMFFLKINAPTSQLVFGLVIAAFFPQLFSLSAHLIRQFIANAFFIYFAMDKIFYKKNKWWLVVAGVFTHASSIILFFLVYFKPLRDFKKHKVLNIALIVLLLSYQFVGKLLLYFLGGINDTFKYILERASTDTTFDLGNFQPLNYVMMFVMIAIALTSRKIIGRQFIKMNESIEDTKEESINKNQERLLIEKDSKFFFSTMIVFSFFILANLNQSELSNRLFFYMFFYFPFVLPLFIARFKQKDLIYYALSILLMLFFTYRLVFGTWEYAPLIEIVTNSFFSYLFQATPSF
ncbi:MAG: EpsG family protein [Flavobacteriaceae bacterium]|nr:EpsG family protein [Flavobacteriaceae bacterium]